MIDVATITKAIEDQLISALGDYTVVRNARRNRDPNVAAANLGWVNVMRGEVEYTPYTTGATPWLVRVMPMIEVQCASMQSGDDAEDRLQDAEKAVLDALNADRTLGGTVLMTLGYRIKYEYNDDEEIYHHAATITLTTEVRA